MSLNPRKPRKSLTHVHVDPATGEVHFSTATQRAWDAFNTRLSLEERREVESKCAELGCSFNEWGMAAVAVLHDREDEFQELRERMSLEATAAILVPLAEQRLRGRLEILRQVRPTPTGAAPLLVQYDLGSGMLDAGERVRGLAARWLAGISDDDKARFEKRCKELGTTLDHFGLTNCAVILEHEEEMKSLHRQMTFADYSTIVDHRTVSRTRGRVEFVRAIRPLLN